MRPGGIGGKIRNMAFKLVVSSCSCGGECGKCAGCGKPPPATGNERENQGKRNAGDNNQ